MNEGWYGDRYLVLFAQGEIPAVSERYDIATMLPGYTVLGLQNWDDFIVQDPHGDLFTVPTVPCVSKRLAPYRLAVPDSALTPDDRFTGKIKWYIKPIVFGGQATASDNVRWISHDEHAALVKWWNAKYRELTGSA